MTPEQQPSPIDLQDGINQEEIAELNKIIELSKNSEEFSKNIKDQLENSKDRKNLSQNILISLSKSNPEDIVANRETFKKLLDNIGKDGVQDTVDFKIWASILDSNVNVELRKSVITEENIKALVENKDIQKKVEGLTKQDQELKNYLNWIIENHKKRVESRQSDIQDLPVYQLAAYGVVYNQESWLIGNGAKSYNLYAIDINTTEWKYNPTIVTDKEGNKILQLDKDRSHDIPLVNKEKPNDLSQENIKQYIGLMQIDNNMNWLDYEKINTYIENLENPTEEERNDLLELIKQAKRLQPTDAKKYDLLTAQLNQLGTHEQSEKNNETWLDQLKTILNLPNQTQEQLLANGTNLFEKNRAAFDVLFSEENQKKLTPEQKITLRNIIIKYMLGEKVDINEKITLDEKDDNWKNIIKNKYILPDLNNISFIINDQKYTQWTKIIQINPSEIQVVNKQWEINSLWKSQDKSYEIFFWTTQQLHDARAEKTKENNYKVSITEITDKQKIWPDGNPILDDKGNPVYEVESSSTDLSKLWNPIDIATFIKYADEAWSYSTFRDVLNLPSTPKDYLANNMQSILETIRTENKEKDGEDDKINGYYNVLANHVAKLARGGDLATLKIYLSFVKDNTSYLGTDSASKIATRNVIGRFGDTYNRDPNNPEHKELQSLLLTAKAQIDPNIKKDIITQIEDGVGAFMEQYWSAIATIVDFFWGKWAFMKMIPAAMREKFMEKFKEANQMTEEQKRNFEDIDKSFAWVNADKNRETESFKGKPKEKAKEIINTLKNQTWDNSDKSKIKSWLENNFTKLSPWLISNIIREYNKKHKDTPIQADTILVSDKKWLPVAIKETEDKTKIIEELLNSESTMRKSIAVAHSHMIENSNYNFSTEDKQMEDENINGTQEYKWIQSFRDVATYIAVYSATGWKPPYNYAISENNISTETNPRIEKPTTPILTPEQQAEKTLKDSIKKITEEIKKPESESIIPKAFNVDDIKTTDNPNKKYFNEIISPLNELLSEKNIDTSSSKTKFAVTADNKGLLESIKNKPQVLKDLITYINPTNKDSLNKSIESVTTLKDITKDTNGNILVNIDDKKKITIKAGPTGPIFEEAAQA